MKFLKALVSASTAAAAMTILSQGASAADFDLTQAEYDAQLNGQYGLSYDEWSLFNEVATTEERVAIDGSDINSILLEDLTWETGADDIEIFFINEGAGLRSELFYSTDGGTLQSIWDDISSQNSLLPENDGALALGQGINLGSFASGTVLDLFLEADGKMFGLDPEANPDGLPHVTAYEADGFLLLGFEDRIGELKDSDFNDVVIAIKGLPDTADVPEPMGTTALLGMGMLGLMRLRRR